MNNGKLILAVALLVVVADGILCYGSRAVLVLPGLLVAGLGLGAVATLCLALLPSSQGNGQ